MVLDTFVYGLYKILSQQVNDTAYHFRFAKTYWSLMIPISIGYIFIVYGLRKIMELRKPFSLQVPLFLWSSALASFSICGVGVAYQEISTNLINNGLHHTFCEQWFDKNALALNWTYFFMVSKIFEFGDTIFMVLRKKPISFLHVYHHSTVLVLTWYLAGQQIVLGQLFGSVNVFVHSIMYTYFALKTLRIYVPKFIAMTVTTLQILQMVVCLFATIFAFIKHQERVCNKIISNDAFIFAMGIYFSYLVLFGNFFKANYLGSITAVSIKLKGK